MSEIVLEEKNIHISNTQITYMTNLCMYLGYFMEKENPVL